MDKLDQLLTAHIGLCIEDEAARFLSLDISGIEYNETIKHNILNFSGRRKRYRGRYATAKIILVAALLALSLIFTAYMAIPKIRAALWRIVLEPHEDHISIRFEQETSETATTAAAPTKAPASDTVTEPPEAPSTIEQFAYIIALPEGYAVQNEASTQTAYVTDYCDASGKLRWRLSQTIIQPDGWQLNYEDGDIITHIQISLAPAILIEYPENPGFYSLTWRDDCYSYNLYGYFDSAEEIRRVGECVKLKGSGETTAEQTTAASSYPNVLKKWAYATYLPKGYTLTEEMSSAASYLAVYSLTAEVNFSLAQIIIGHDSWLLDYDEGDILTYTQVNGYSAAMIEYPKDPGCYSLTWQDDQYSYNLFGYFPSETDPVKVAEGLTLKDIPAKTEKVTSALTTAAPQTSVAEITPTPPKKIEQIAYIDHLPSGWYSDPTQKSSTAAGTDYRDAEGNFRFYLAQSVFSVDAYLNSENQAMTKTTVLGYPALLMKDSEEKNIYMLTWTDGLYVYDLYGIFDSVSQLMHFAESLKLKAIPAQTTTAQTTPQASAAKTASTPPKTIEQVAYISPLPNKWYGETVVSNRSAAIINYFDQSGNLKFVLTQVLLSGKNRFDSEDVTITKTNVLGYPALLMNDTIEQSHTLTWTDGLYNYTLYGIFDSVSQLMRFAESLKLK